MGKEDPRNVQGRKGDKGVSHMGEGKEGGKEGQKEHSSIF